MKQISQPFPTVQRLSFVRDDRDERNTAVINHRKRSSLLYSSIYIAKEREASIEQRLAAANILNAHLLMVEIMMSNVIQKYVYNVYSDLENRGMMHHLSRKTPSRCIPSLSTYKAGATTTTSNRYALSAGTFTRLWWKSTLMPEELSL